MFLLLLLLVFFLSFFLSLFLHLTQSFPDELKKVRDIEEVEGYLATKRSVRRLSKKMDKTIPFFGARDDDDEEEVETDDDEGWMLLWW